MPQKYYIVPARGPVDPGFGIPGTGPVDPDYGIEAPPPEVGGGPLPPLPGIWPPPGRPGLPIALPPITLPHPENPIVIPGTPENPINLPPGIYPPLPPDLGVDGKIAILVWVVGVGKRWVVVDTNVKPGHPLPPFPEPKGR